MSQMKSNSIELLTKNRDVVNFNLFFSSLKVRIEVNAPIHPYYVHTYSKSTKLYFYFVFCSFAITRNITTYKFLKSCTTAQQLTVQCYSL